MASSSTSKKFGLPVGRRRKVHVKGRVKTQVNASATTKLNNLLQEEKDGDDVVLKEFPVYLSKTLLEQLCLVQYPQRPASVSTQNMDILETKIKPGQMKLGITLGMDPESELYDPESGELLAEAAEGLGLDEDEYMPDHRLRLDKTTMESTAVPKLTESPRYAIGVVRRGVVTFTPLNSIVQMKTVFPYLNKADKARSAFQREKEGGPPDPEEGGGGEGTEAEKVTVKFSRASSAGSTATSTTTSRPTSSYTARKREEEEPWMELDYVAEDPKEFDKLYTTASSTPFYVLNKTEYLDALFPKHFETSITAEGGADKKLGQPQRISIVQMKNMPIQEQLRVLLTNAKVLQYNQILEFLKIKLKSETDDVSLLKSIQIVGILVQGCWVVKSEVLYSEDFKSGANGISGPVMQRGRDAILSQFTEHRFVERKKMMSITKLPAEEVSDILKQFSILVPNKGWEFLLPYDTNFLGRFPEVVERQSLIWQMKKQQRSRTSSTGELVGGGRHNSPPRGRRGSRVKSFSSGGSGDEGGGEDGLRGGRRRRSEQGDGHGRDGSGRQRRNSNRANVVGSRAET